MKNSLYSAIDTVTLAISQVITAKLHIRILAAAIATVVLHFALAVTSTFLYNTAHRNIIATAVALYLVYAAIQWKRQKRCHWKIALPAVFILTGLFTTILMYTQYFLRTSIVPSYLFLLLLVCGGLQMYQKWAT